VCTVWCLYGSFDLRELGWLGRGGRRLLLNEPYVHQSVAHREAMPRAKTVGVAHSSYGPIHVLRFSSTLVVFWNLLLSLVTVGYVFYSLAHRYLYGVVWRSFHSIL
jgi:hypothetical protein